MKKKNGSILVLTLVVMALLMVLGTSLFTMSVSSYKVEVATDNSSKLNMMAESGMEIALAQVKKATSASGLVSFVGLKSDDSAINKFGNKLEINHNILGDIKFLENLLERYSNFSDSEERNIKKKLTELNKARGSM